MTTVSSANRTRTATVDVVIVNWNTGPALRACLRSIERTDRSVLEVGAVVVVDNASRDRSADRLEPSALPLSIVRNRENRGFAAGCNQGAAHRTGDYLLFLNPDTELYPDTLRTVGEFLSTPAAADVGILGGRILDARGRPGISCSRFPTLPILFGKMTGLDRMLPTVFPPHHLGPAETRRSGPVDQVIGAFYLVRRPLFEQLGGFDQRYFLYYEEVDLALRARQCGWRSYYLGEARIYHAGNTSTDQVRGRRLSYSLRSRTLYSRRHWSRGQAGLLVVLTFAVELPARLARAVLHGSRAELRETVDGLAGYLRWLLRRAPAAGS
ncbi:N-acetylglucosaminyl-diphospho-decaprenol L-rhamnosyltransferase [Kitasatospora sp. MAP12-15]|uniref:glycosyltransferase family 2 protein n=1 Tax=unclassified Kitasatospora TaxID=2633591 RepID=UPI0024756F08|nr:glycosyltransferase family 2 protein [Kitasatospora sp. MAP12-44]MDH6108526.1 N-acetylglucosaminyl-diphospho-decaprenol L-rhamnosyltransferase [Kitasatospora sp. MAP12-44]